MFEKCEKTRFRRTWIHVVVVVTPPAPFATPPTPTPVTSAPTAPLPPPTIGPVPPPTLTPIVVATTPAPLSLPTLSPVLAPTIASRTLPSGAPVVAPDVSPLIVGVAIGAAVGVVAVFAVAFGVFYCIYRQGGNHVTSKPTNASSDTGSNNQNDNFESPQSPTPLSNPTDRSVLASLVVQPTPLNSSMMDAPIEKRSVYVPDLNMPMRTDISPQTASSQRMQRRYPANNHVLDVKDQCRSVAAIMVPPSSPSPAVVSYPANNHVLDVKDQCRTVDAIMVPPSSPSPAVVAPSNGNHAVPFAVAVGVSTTIAASTTTAPKDESSGRAALSDA